MSGALGVRNQDNPAPCPRNTLAIRQIEGRVSGGWRIAICTQRHRLLQ
jgi:hypothetical protein